MKKKAGFNRPPWLWIWMLFWRESPAERLEELRRKVYERSGGWCESKIADDCWRSVTWDTGHMHHKKHRSLGGSDTMRNCIFICPACHRKEHGR